MIDRAVLTALYDQNITSELVAFCGFYAGFSLLRYIWTERGDRSFENLSLKFSDCSFLDFERSFDARAYPVYGYSEQYDAGGNFQNFYENAAQVMIR